MTDYEEIGTAANEVNPFRYRGYYYNSEIGLYYLQSRYYNPEWGRFLNADVYVNANGDLMGYNMYAYCSNNPVMGYDPTGHFDEFPIDLDIDDPFDEHGPIGGGSGFTTKAATGGRSFAKGFSSKFKVSYKFKATKSIRGLNGKKFNYKLSKTEVHHIVEQCQATKSGFSKAMIQHASNKIVLSYRAHRAISALYSSKRPDLTAGSTLIVRNWLAGQSFEAQTQFGLEMIRVIKSERILLK